MANKSMQTPVGFDDDGNIIYASNEVSGSSAADKQREAWNQEFNYNVQRQLMDIQNQFNAEQAQIAREWSSESAQRQRMEEAGFNVNMLSGSQHSPAVATSGSGGSSVGGFNPSQPHMSKFHRSLQKVETIAEALRDIGSTAASLSGATTDIIKTPSQIDANFGQFLAGLGSGLKSGSEAALNRIDARTRDEANRWAINLRRSGTASNYASASRDNSIADINDVELAHRGELLRSKIGLNDAQTDNLKAITANTHVDTDFLRRTFEDRALKAEYDAIVSKNSAGLEYWQAQKVQKELNLVWYKAWEMYTRSRYLSVQTVATSLDNIIRDIQIDYLPMEKQLAIYQQVASIFTDVINSIDPIARASGQVGDALNGMTGNENGSSGNVERFLKWRRDHPNGTYGEADRELNFNGNLYEWLGH